MKGSKSVVALRSNRTSAAEPDAGRTAKTSATTISAGTSERGLMRDIYHRSASRSEVRMRYLQGFLSFGSDVNARLHVFARPLYWPAMESTQIRPRR